MLNNSIYGIGKQKVMNKFSKLIIGFVSVISMSFLKSAPFERNPQNCEMISVTKKKKKELDRIID
jgi:hypothetical protein